jgi:hypothetical protein
MSLHISTSPLDSLQRDLLPVLSELCDTQAPPATEPTTDDAMLENALAIYTFIKEKHCFQTLAYIQNITKMVILTNTLFAKGVTMYLRGIGQPMDYWPPDLTDPKIPWPILHLFCRLEYLSCRGKNESSHPESKALLLDCFKAEKRFSQNKEKISCIIDSFRLGEILSSLNISLKTACAPICHWFDTKKSSTLGAEAVDLAMRASSLYQTAMKAVDTWYAELASAPARPDLASSRSARRGSRGSASSSQAKVFDPKDVQSLKNNTAKEQMLGFIAAHDGYARLTSQAIREFSANVLPKLGHFYTHLYHNLESEARQRHTSIDKIILQAVPKRSLLRVVPFADELESFPAENAQLLRGFDIRVIPSPEDFAMPLHDVHCFSLTEEYRTQYELEESRVTPKPVLQLDFLPIHLQKTSPAALPKKQQASATVSKRRSAKHHVPISVIDAKKTSQPTPKESCCTTPCAPSAPVSMDLSMSLPMPLPIERKEFPPISEKPCYTTPCSSAAPSLEALLSSPPSPLSIERKEPRPVSEESCCVTPCSSLSSSLIAQEDYDFSVHVGDGPDPALLYSDRVARWTNGSRDVFHEDPVYRSGTYSKSLKEEIRFRHSFGRALVSVILKEGKRFEKEGGRGMGRSENRTLPGEIIKSNGDYEKVVFTVSSDTQTGEIFHIYASHKTPMTLRDEYAKKGFFAADEEELPKSVSGVKRCGLQKAHPLPDDGSRIIEVSSEHISVQQSDGTVLNVYPFPDIL